jgi:hypothetical protein
MYRHWVATILTPVVGLVDGTFEMAVVMVAEILESVSFGITHIPRRFLQGLKRGSSTESFDIGGFFDRK